MSTPINSYDLFVCTYFHAYLDLMGLPQLELNPWPEVPYPGIFENLDQRSEFLVIYQGTL